MKPLCLLGLAALSISVLALGSCGNEPKAPDDSGSGASGVSTGAGGQGGSSDVDRGPTKDDLGDSLVLSIRSDPDGFLSVVQGTATGSMISSLVAPALTDSDFKNGKLIHLPYLAESWSFDSTHTKLTMKLKKGVNWPDGKPITAHDVAFTYELIKDTTVASPRRAYLDNMDEKEPITVLDDYTVRINFKWAYNESTMLSHAGAVSIAPKHLLENAERGGLRKHELHKKRAFGHGPFTLQSWKPKESLTLVRNPDFKLANSNGGVPYLDRLIFRIIPTYPTQLQALKDGQIDLMEAIQEKDLEKVKTWPNVKVYTKGYRFMDYICWNLANPLFQSKKVRRALTMGIDIQRMIDSLLTFDGVCYGTQAYSTITPELADYRLEALKLIPHDKAAAKKLLAEEGWTDSDGDGVLDKDGKKFAFKLATNTANPRRADGVILVKDDLRKLGIQVTIEMIEPNTFFDNLRHKDYEAALAGWSAGLFVDPSDIWGTPTKEDKKPFNHCGYSNSRVDELIDKGLHTASLEEEKACWKELQEIIYDEQPYTFLFWRKESFAVSKRVRGIHPNILTTLFGIQSWWVPKKEHKFDF